jgi:NaMN:DMB phosphoribosyltransferase
VHPVLDNRNKPIKTPDAFQVNTSIQRCLAKAIALHGLGLYIFAGEDLPDVSLSEEEKNSILELATKVGKEEKERVENALGSGNLNKGNYSKALSSLKGLLKNKENVDE